MFTHLYRKYCSLNLKYIFAVASAIQIRASRRNAKSINVHFSLMDHIAVPDKPTYEGLKMYLHMFYDDRAMLPDFDQKANIFLTPNASEATH
jgi:hypothetical protein